MLAAAFGKFWGQCVFFSTHWRGEYSLAISYWFNFVALGAAANYLLTWWVNNALVVLSPYLRPKGIQIAILGGVVLFVAFAVWAIVGVWRAAGKRIAQGIFVWACIARIIVAVAACLITYNFYAGLTGRPIIATSQDRAIDKATKPSVASVLKAMEIHWLDSLPKKLDDITELTTVAAIGTSFNFYYAIAPDSLPLVRFELIREQVLNGTCESTIDVDLLGRGASYHFWYSDGVGQHVRKFSIHGSDCRCLKRDALGDCLEAIVSK